MDPDNRALKVLVNLDIQLWDRDMQRMVLYNQVPPGLVNLDSRQ